MHRIFGKKESVLCAVCGKELGRHKYRPAKEWNISGLLCADCHIDKTREFMLAREQEDPKEEKCAVCGKQIASDEDRMKAKWQWNMESGVVVCKPCYQRKDSEYDHKTNFCASCGCKLGLFFYHPKPAWKMEGNLCRRCWDKINATGVG